MNSTPPSLPLLARSTLPLRERQADVARLRRDVARAVDGGGVLRPGETVVVAVSGGPDSTALLDALARLAPTRCWRLCCVHVDHGLRSGSDAEAAVVAELAATRQVAFESVRATLPARGSPQDRARRGRYAALGAVADRIGATAIAVGHTADDQAETVLMRVLCGAPPMALMAMAPRCGRLARPLLGITRRQTIAYCAALALTPLDDPSNADPRYLRSRIRHELMPALDAVMPAVRRRLVALAEAQRRSLTEMQGSPASLSRTSAGIH